MARRTTFGLASLAVVACWSGARAQDAPVTGRDTPKRARALCDAGDFDKAEALLSRRLAILPYDTEARLLLARLLDWNGEADEAIALLDYACGDVAALSDEASILARQALDGPRVRRRRGEVLRSPGRDPAADEAWKAERRQRAAGLLDKAHSLSGGSDETARLLAALRGGGEVAPACSDWSSHRAGR